MAHPSQHDEFGLIADFFAPLATEAALGLRDDAACLTPKPGFDLVVTADAMVQGVHFLADDPADLIARKLLRVNLSDLAAMAAAPVGYLLTAAWPGATSDDWIAAFARGLGADQERFDCRLLGGDTVATPGPLVLSLTALGQVPHGGALRRAGAQPGDCLFVSGTIGDSFLGLNVLQEKITSLDEDDARYLIDRYRLPRPRLELGQALGQVADAAIDVSDGLVADLGHLAAQSGLHAEIQADRVPLSEPGRRALARLPDAAHLPLVGGDDYELLFAAPPSERDAVAAIAARLELPITEIGALSPGSGVMVLAGDGGELALPETGWRHRRPGRR